MYVKSAYLPVARPARDPPRTRPTPHATSPRTRPAPHATQPVRDPLRVVAYCASISARAAWAALVPAKRPEV